MEHIVSAIHFITSYLVTNYRSGYVRLINYTFNTYYVNESDIWECKRSITIQQYNLDSSCCAHLEDCRHRPLWGVSQGILPPAFGISAGVGDILIGVTAIPFAYFLRKGFSWSKYALVVWSVLGIADLVNAISLGLITASELPGSTMTTFPWILIPIMGVPLALILHGITLYRLRSTGFPSST